MKFYLGRFKANGKVCFGAIEEEQVYDLSLSSMWRQEKLSTPNNPIDILVSDRHIKQVATFIKKLKNSDTKLGVFNLSDIKLLPPVIPEKIIGIGLNYVGHIKMQKAEIPEHPGMFLKSLTGLIGTGDEIIKPKHFLNPVTFGVELCLVIGKGGKNIKEEDVLEHIAGYTILNDVTLRGFQDTKGKLFDTFTPVGPWIAPKSQIINPSALQLKSWVNGELCQNGNTSKALFSLNKIISVVSQVMTLKPGDLIATGDPGFLSKDNSPVLLEEGDIVELEIESIGKLKNIVVNEK